MSTYSDENKFLAHHFCHFVVRQDFEFKIGTDRKEGKNIFPPTRAGFALLSGPPFIRTWSGGSRSDQWLFFLFEPLRRDPGTNSRKFRFSGRICPSRKNPNSVSFWDFLFRDEFSPTEDREGVRLGFGWEPGYQKKWL